MASGAVPVMAMMMLISTNHSRLSSVRPVAEVLIDGGNEVLPMLPDCILELHQIATPPRERWRTIAQEGGALPDERGGQSIIGLDCCPISHGSLHVSRTRTLELACLRLVA
jgi:hypothetical protein